MKMHRLIRLWNWLPAFRAVAQTEHLPTASARLNVSASALSRSIRLLEEDVGVPLFDRVGRRLALNAEGKLLLDAVRDAMRRVDDALARLERRTLAGSFGLSAPSAFFPVCVLPALKVLAQSHPDLRPRLTTLSAPDVNAHLLEGTLDLALLDDPEPAEGVVIEPLTRIRYGVYCGVGHPLRDAPRVDRATLAEHAFVAPPAGADDHWPKHWPRRVTTEVHTLELGLSMCSGGGHLAVLPDLVAEHHPRAEDLARVDFDLGVDAALHAVYRRPLGDRLLGAVHEVLVVVEDVLAGLQGGELR